MAYVGYADKKYYKDVYGGSAIDESNIEKALRNASRHIDTLTYNRIVGRGINNLTEFQQDVVRESVCKLADFEYENDELISCVLQQYSINGVGMSFGNSWNVKVQNGVAINAADYEFLCQSGLCCRSLGGVR